MKTIGLLVAVETDALQAHYTDLEKCPCPKGFELYRRTSGNATLYILHCGMGEIYASAGASYLIHVCGAECIVNFGVVGGLTADMAKHSLCVIDRLVHYKFDASEFMPVKIGQVPPYEDIYLQPDASLVEKAVTLCPSLTRVTCASGDKFISTAEEKSAIHRDFDADICEMEAVGIYLTCALNDVPCLFLKAVSDGLADGADGFWAELTKAALTCLEVTDGIIAALCD